jgi:MATE family multidrug resistance protein
LLLAVALALPLMLVARLIGPALGLIGVTPDVHQRTLPYLDATAWGSLPLLIYAAARRYLQAVERVGVVMFALVTANVVNALAGWALVYGKLGAPALGVVGTGWATTFSRTYMAVILLAAALGDAGRRGGDAPKGLWRPDLGRLRRLIGLGLPAAAQVTLEVGVFAMATALAGRLAPRALAAHQVVLSLSSVTFMIPLGLASAAVMSPAAPESSWGTRSGEAIARRPPSPAGRPSRWGRPSWRSRRRSSRCSQAP